MNENGPNGLNWQCCLAGSSKSAPRILIFFSMAIGANYSFELIFIETYAPQFIGHNKFFLGSVIPCNLSIMELLKIRGKIFCKPWIFGKIYQINGISSNRGVTKNLSQARSLYQ